MKEKCVKYQMLWLWNKLKSLREVSEGDMCQIPMKGMIKNTGPRLSQAEMSHTLKKSLMEIAYLSSCPMTAAGTRGDAAHDRHKRGLK